MTMPGAGDRLVELEVAVAVRAHDADPVALLDAEAAQRADERAGSGPTSRAYVSDTSPHATAGRRGADLHGAPQRRDHRGHGAPPATRGERGCGRRARGRCSERARSSRGARASSVARGSTSRTCAALHPHDPAQLGRRVVRDALADHRGALGDVHRVAGVEAAARRRRCRPAAATCRRRAAPGPRPRRPRSCRATASRSAATA